MIEQLDYNLLFRSFVGLRMEHVVQNLCGVSKNRDRLAKRLMSDKHFTVDGTLI